MVNMIEAQAEYPEKKSLRESLKGVLQDIAQELGPQYNGSLVVERNTEDIFNHPHQYLIEKREKTKPRLIRKPRIYTVSKIVCGVREHHFDDGHIEIGINDPRVEDVIKRHFEQYAERFGIKDIEIYRHPTLSLWDVM